MMKKIALSAAVLFLFFAGTSGVQAHAPKTVDLSYDLAEQVLTVTIDHWAVSTSTHFIEKVVIKKNGKVVEKKEYTSQPSAEEFSYTYKIPAEPGDKFEVTAACSVHGSKSSSLTVKAPKPPKEQEK